VVLLDLRKAIQLVNKLKRKSEEFEVIVISSVHGFLYVLSLLRFPYGRREVEDVKLALRPIFGENKI
jgi:hypothetical protein